MSDRTNAYYLIELLNSVLQGETPAEPSSSVNLEAVLDIAANHSVANMAFYGVERLDCTIPDELRRRWSELRDMAILKDITQQVEYESITASLRRNSIRFLPVKGFILKELYPQGDMRLMSDLDILIDSSNARAARDVMLSLGYTVEKFGSGADDVYHKKPVMSVELHRELFGYEGREYADLFPDPWLLAAEDNSCCTFDTNTCFTYILAHALKHLGEGGTGIRTFMDIYLYLDHHRADIDLPAIYTAFDRIDRGRICRDVIALSEKWFGGEAVSSSTEALEDYVIGSGTYGTYENTVKSTGKSRYIFQLIFPPFGRMKSQYPVLKKAPVLLPFCWIWRLIVKPFANFSQNKAKLNALTKKK